MIGIATSKEMWHIVSEKTVRMKLGCEVESCGSGHGGLSLNSRGLRPTSSGLLCEL